MPRTAVTALRTYTMASSALFVECCCVCGMLFGIPESVERERRRNHDWFYCPNGHVQRYPAMSAIDTARAERDAAQRRAEMAEEAARQLRLSRNALRGQITKMKKRVAAGVCPVPGCKRSGFSAVMRHVASKHPDWYHDHKEQLQG